MQVIQGVVVGPAEAQFKSPIADYKLLSAQTGGAVIAHAGTFAPGILVPPHTHSREDELLYVLEGELTVELGDEIFNAPAGATVWRPRGQRHALWNSTKQPMRFFEVISPGGNFESFTQALMRVMTSGDFREQLPQVAKAHGIEFDVQHAGELIGRFNLRPVGA